MTGDGTLPEIPGDHLAAFWYVADWQRFFVLCGVPFERLSLRLPVIGHQDVNGTTHGLSNPSHRLTSRKSSHSTPFGQNITHDNDRPTDLIQLVRNSPNEQNRHKAGKEATGPDDNRIEIPYGQSHEWMNLDPWIKPDALYAATFGLLGIDLELAASA